MMCIPVRQGLVALSLVTSSVPLPASAEIVVTGTGNPSVDVPAVQAAVNAGGTIRLKGHFSFDVPPVDDRTVLVTTSVVVEGIADEGGGMPVISGGVKPFQVNAPGSSVTFRNLRFVGARLTVVEIRAADGVTIERCRIDGVEPLFASAINANLAIGLVLGFFTSGQVVGSISIVGNELDIGGTAVDRTEAIAAIGVGNAGRPAEMRIADNVVRNTTAHAIDVRNIVGSAAIERNDISTGATGGQMVMTGDRFVDGIRCLGAGSYLVSHNRIEIGYENAAGIRLQGGPAAAVAGAVVFSNDITMGAPDGAAFGSESAGIELRRAAAANTVSSNRIRGRASAAIALVFELGAAPVMTTFIGNNHASFAATLADLLIGMGVVDTTVVGGHGTVIDHGMGTTLKGGYVVP